MNMDKRRPSDLDSEGKQHAGQALNSRMDRLRMRHLRLLDMVARGGSLSAAAESIGMSQPGATKMLHELEDAFGCKLIERSAKGAQFTPAGTHALDRMRIALHALGTARTAIASRKELPLVRLGMIPIVGITALSHVIGAIQAHAELPRIQIQLGTVEGLLQELSEGRVDCVVGFLDDTTTSGSIRQFRLTPLWEEPLVIVAAVDHPLARRRKVSLVIVRDCDWVLMPRDSSNRRAVDRLFLQAGLEPPVPRIETRSFHVGLSLAAGSRLLAAAPESAYRQYQSQVRRLPIDQAFPTASMVFATLADMPMLPSVEMISQQFQAYARSIAVPKPKRTPHFLPSSAAGQQRPAGAVRIRRQAA